MEVAEQEMIQRRWNTAGIVTHKRIWDADAWIALAVSM
jgi:hypothetical protein